MNFTEKDKNLAKYVIDYALKNGCSQIKVGLSAGVENAVEWRDGNITDLTSSQSLSMRIHLFVDGRFSVIRTNRLDECELKYFVNRGIENTRLLAEDPFARLPDPSLYYKGVVDDMGLCDDGFAEVDMESRVKMAKDAVAEIDDSRVILASASVGDYMLSQFVITSNGFSAETHNSSYVVSSEVSVRGLGDERPGATAYAVSTHLGKLPKKGIGSEALKRAVSRIGAKKIKSGKYNIVVDRRVSSNLFDPIVSALDANALYQKSSFLLDRKDTTIASDKLTVVDNPLQPGKIGACYFDRECLALKPMTVIDRGVLKNYYVSDYMSRKSGLERTHNSPAVIDFVHDGIDTSSLLKQMVNGVYITGFNGGNCNGTTGDFSYGIEGFVVRNGVIAEPISEMLITGNMLDLWQNLVLVSNDPLYFDTWNIGSLLFHDVILN